MSEICNKIEKTASWKLPKNRKKCMEKDAEFVQCFGHATQYVSKLKYA